MRFLDARTHTIVGLVAGVVLVVAPWLLGFDDVSRARGVAVWVGVWIVANELVTTSPVSPLKVVPMRLHLALDVVTGVFLAVSPWLFGFHDEGTSAWLPHVVFGALVVGYALATRPGSEVPPMGEHVPPGRRESDHL